MQNIIDTIRTWYTEYINSYKDESSEQYYNFLLKEKHSDRVCAVALEIAAQEHFDKADTTCIEIAALLHDVGRFEQLKKYGTFLDHLSENHALISLREIKKHNVLAALDHMERDLVIKTIAYHNRKYIPQNISGRLARITKTIRDADKIDILHFATTHYQNPSIETKSAVTLDLPDTPDINEAAFASVMNGTIVNNEDVKGYNDFKVMQIGWVYDMHYSHTFKLVQQRHYLETIRDALPEGEKTEMLYRKVKTYIDNKLHEQ